MADDIIIDVAHVSKEYRLYARRRDKVLEAIDPRHRCRHTPFPALHDISFTVCRGESLGIMGVNGAGKSTLLKLLCRVITPTMGKVAVNGRISALLELGAGFHPERTGLENLYFQGAIQGFSRRETEAMIPDIVAFADIGDFINQPVKVYSSGMFIRLAFAAAVQVKPDILIVDEALSVGDARFQRRCFARIDEMRTEGVTFLFVSHSTEEIVRQCNRALLLADGEILMDGLPRDVANRYLDILFGRDLAEEAVEKAEIMTPQAISADPALCAFLQDSSAEDRFAANPLYNPYEYRWGNGGAKILDVMLSSTGDPLHIVAGDTLTLHVKALFLRDFFRPIWGCTIKTKDGVTVYGTNSEINNAQKAGKAVTAGAMAVSSFAFRCDLAPGEYFISLGLATDAGDNPLDRRYDALLLVVHGPTNFFGLGDLHMHIETEC